jgi:hypothetical protein
MLHDESNVCRGYKVDGARLRLAHPRYRSYATDQVAVQETEGLLWQSLPPIRRPSSTILKCLLSQIKQLGLGTPASSGQSAPLPPAYSYSCYAFPRHWAGAVDNGVSRSRQQPFVAICVKRTRISTADRDSGIEAWIKCLFAEQEVPIAPVRGGFGGYRTERTYGGRWPKSMELVPCCKQSF